MPKRFIIQLSESEHKELQKLATNSAKPHLRYKAKAILQVAAGIPVWQVAQSLKLRTHRTTVAGWVKRYLDEGIQGLKIKPGRGRKPGFSPWQPDPSPR